MKDKEYFKDDEWDEEDWERFLQKTDVRTAKYMELFETLHNHPECDNLIAEEMGWSRKYEDCKDNNKSCNECEKNEECNIYEMSQIFEDSLAFGETTERDIEDVKKITAYKKSYELYIKLSEYFNNWKEAGNDENIIEAIAASSMVPAKIAGGHGMGYEKDSLCGNIANCKRSLKNARLCVYSLEILKAKSTYPDSDLRLLIKEAVNVEQEIIKWIEYLRSKIWWR